MKIVFVNTLRLGDSLMALEVLRSLSQKYPLAKIDYVCFDESRPLVDLVNLPVHFHIIERKKIQRLYTDLSVDFFRPFDLLAENLSGVWNEKYDLCINYSNTVISTHICSALQAKAKIGSNFNSQNILNYGSKWIEYLDKIITSEPGLFHFNEIFMNALFLTPVQTNPFRETKRAKLETQKVIHSNHPYIVLQYESSDPKKDLNLRHAQMIVDRLSEKGYRVCVPCPPAKDDAYKSALDGAIVVPCHFDGLKRLLDYAELVVTVDTSTKQLANYVSTPLLEISLGSSKPIQTGPYRENSYIVQSKVACYPCPHSSDCDNNYLCSRSLEGAELCALILDLLSKDKIGKYESFDISTVLKESNFYFLIKEDGNQAKDLLTKLSLYKHFSTNHKVTGKLVYKVHRRFDLLRLKEKLIKLDAIKANIANLSDYIELGKPVGKFILSKDYLALEEGLESLSFPSEFLSLQQIPLDKKFDFHLMRTAQNFLKESRTYIENMKMLILDIESEGSYAQR
tara:strand:- start:7962 stop:9494 length:1533 start_codon:yes stop_codon:yes gene_type:complete